MNPNDLLNIGKPQAKAPAKKQAPFVPVQAGGWEDGALGMNFALPDMPEVQAAPAASSFDSAAAAKASKLAGLRGGIRSYEGEVGSIYDQLFADIDTLIASRKAEIEENAGKNIKNLTDNYLGAIPGIDSSYAALGAYDSTDRGDARKKADDGFVSSTEELGKQKSQDLTKLGEYGATTKADWGAEREALNRMFSRLDETENEQDLYGVRNDIETQLGKAKASKASLMTDEGLKGSIAKGTDSSSRMGSIQASLDAILNSSLSNAVKGAAQQAVGQSAGLTPEEKNQIKANSGYAS